MHQVSSNAKVLARSGLLFPVSFYAMYSAPQVELEHASERKISKVKLSSCSSPLHKRKKLLFFSQVGMVLEKLLENKKIAEATHNIYAFRCGDIVRFVLPPLIPPVFW